MSEIKFLNIDLDIESKEDISLIVQEFGSQLSVMRYDQSEGLYSASFETGYIEENKIIEEYTNLINKLSPRAKTQWDNCILRRFDIGYESGERPYNFHSKLSENSISLLAKVGGSIVVTIYPPDPNDT
jgi:hypothetical protein